MSFVPPGQEIPKAPSDYLKLEDGENKVRILADSIGGWKYQLLDDTWVFSKDMPKIAIGKVKTDMYGAQFKYFIAAPVWSYRDEDVKVIEIQQTSIMNQIEAMENDSDWGDVKGYDIKINKTGKGKETRYNVSGNPKSEPIKQEWLDILEVKKADEKTGRRYRCKWEDENNETPITDEKGLAEKEEEKSEQIQDLSDDLPF